jgi:regulatory protein
MSELFRQSDIVKIPYSLHDNVIVELIKDDFLNEERFVFSFVRGKFRIKKWGKIKLRNELFQRNITSFLINNAIGQINDNDYMETFDEIALKKFNNLNNETDLSSKKKFVTYLQYRGWETDLIFKKVNVLFKT